MAPRNEYDVAAVGFEDLVECAVFGVDVLNGESGLFFGLVEIYLLEVGLQKFTVCIHLSLVVFMGRKGAPVARRSVDLHTHQPVARRPGRQDSVYLPAGIVAAAQFDAHILHRAGGDKERFMHLVGSHPSAGYIQCLAPGRQDEFRVGRKVKSVRQAAEYIPSTTVSTPVSAIRCDGEVAAQQYDAPLGPASVVPPRFISFHRAGTKIQMLPSGIPRRNVLIHRLRSRFNQQIVHNHQK